MTRNVLSRASVCVCVCVSVCLSVRGRMPTLLHGPGCNLTLAATQPHGSPITLFSCVPRQPMGPPMINQTTKSLIFMPAT